MTLSPRRRIAALGLIAFVLGLLTTWLADRTGRIVYSVTGGCGAPGGQTICRGLSAYPGSLRSLVVAVVVLVLAGALLRASRWPLAALQPTIAAIRQVGPQNLGFRLRPAGPDDEIRRLGRAVDEMMERIAAGYEGQRRFAANASHELRTPLAVQRTLIEVGMAQPLTQPQIELLTRQLLQTNERNEQLIEGLLVLSESDQGLAARTPQRLDEIAAAVVAAHQERAAAAGVRLTAELRPRVVAGEQVLLERLVTNLVQNAIKYNRPEGSVQVSVGAVPALTVTNTGPVIPAEAVPRLFEPFRRLSSDRTDHGGGSGLGLTIARSITQAHDGTVSAAALRPDGFRVDVQLPGAAPEAAVTP